jgi:hypothetical protein
MVMKRFENVNKITVAIMGYRARNAGIGVWFPARPPPKRRVRALRSAQQKI